MSPITPAVVAGLVLIKTFHPVIPPPDPRQRVTFLTGENKMALSSKEKMAAHRARKAAAAFSDKYLCGDTTVSPNRFIKAQEEELGAKFHCSYIQFQ